MKWQKMEPARRPDYAHDPHQVAKKTGLTLKEAEEYVRNADQTRYFLNDRYQADVRDLGSPIAGWPSIIHISIKRRDKEVVHDWRDLQRIKNDVLGPEHEAVELYPAESRLVDSANQYHLWALASPTARWPFGYEERLVEGPDRARRVGAKQRAFDESGAP